MKMISLSYLCAGWLLLCTPHLQAQATRPQSGGTSTVKPRNQAKPKRNPSNVTPAQVEAADLAITANISARELRFKQVGEVKVKFSGTPQRDTVWEEQRQNFPKPAQPNVTYRDIGSQLRIISRFSNIEQLLAPDSASSAPPGLTLGQKQPPASTAPAQMKLGSIPAPLAPVPVSAAPIPQPKAVLPPKPVLPVKPMPSNNSQGR
jgi:hypothetical protein